MKSVDADVFFTRRLLGLDQPGGTIYADNKTSRHLRIQGSAVSSLLHLQYPLDPSHDLVRAGVGRFVETNEPGLDIVRDVSLQWRCSVRKGCVMVGSDI